MRDFQKLDAWQRAHQLVLDIHSDTEAFPADERFSLVDQLRRAALSITSNIAEGAGRPSRKDYARFLGVAIGSANELTSQMLVARDLGYVPADLYITRADHIDEVRRKLIRLRVSVLNG